LPCAEKSTGEHRSGPSLGHYIGGKADDAGLDALSEVDGRLPKLALGRGRRENRLASGRSCGEQQASGET
jgi:hypothetical protein